jgi:hypothetical protein
MTYFDDYKKRVQAGGQNIEDSVTKSSISLVNSTFADSPSYGTVTLNGVNKEARINISDDSKELSLLYRPLTLSNVGDFIIFNGVNWLVFSVKNHEVYPKAVAQRCNESLKWKDSTGTIKEYKAVIASGGTSFGIDDADRIEMNTLEGELRAYVQYNSFTKTIVATQRFIIGSQVYQIKGMDDVTDVINGSGLIRFSLRLTTKSPLDDFVNKVADNSQVIKPNTGGSGGSQPW